MSITGPLVLPRDVVLLPMTELDEETRAGARAEDGDCAIVRPFARTLAALVDRETATLVASFRTPRHVAHVAYAWARATGAPLDEALRDVVARIEPFIERRLLVHPDSPEAAVIVARHAHGDRLGSWVVVRPVRTLDDTEVYQVRGKELGALKIVRGTSSDSSAAIEREKRLLRSLDLPVSPRLVGEGEHDGRAFIVTAWQPGVSALRAATELRGRGSRGDFAAVARLCAEILRAYAALHRAGIVHGDVHPQNVLVAADGSVHIVDFGLARRLGDAPGEVAVVPRGGVPLFAEPEWARAVLAGREPPAASLAGEQFSLGALLFLLLTGTHYLGAAREMDEVLRRAAAPAPPSFRSLGVAPHERVERVVRRALDSAPHARHESVQEFLDLFVHALGRHARSCPTPAGVRRGRERFVSAAFQRADEAASCPATMPPASPRPAPRCSVAYGSAGTAYAFYRLALARSDPFALARAHHHHALTIARANTPDAFVSDALEIDERTVGAVSVLHAEPGVHCVGALIARASGDGRVFARSVDRFVSASRLPHRHHDLALGTAGTLSTCALLVEAVPHGAPAPSGLLDLGEYAASRVARVLRAGPIGGRADDTDYLGLAHGWGGLLYAALRWSEARHADPPCSLLERVEELVRRAVPVGRGLRWPWGSSPALAGRHMPGWCSGSAGLVHLWLAVHRATGEDRFLEAAEGSAWNAWESPGDGIDLCCGLAGRAYSLLALHAQTGDGAWLRRAADLADRALRRGMSPEHRDSLYRGELGLALLLAELDTPQDAAMPMVGREGWPTVDEPRERSTTR